MTERRERMLSPDKHPNEQELSAWLGERSYKRWAQIVGFIDSNYPDVFSPEWLFGGKKHGWSLRYKRSKSFCTLIPERNRLMIQIVLGGQERAAVETILTELTPYVRDIYEAATTYHDGKWLFLAVDSDDMLADVKRLLTIRRKPKKNAP